MQHVLTLMVTAVPPWPIRAANTADRGADRRRATATQYFPDRRK